MPWAIFFLIFALIDVVVLWSALTGSKRKAAPVYFEEERLPPENAFKDY
jgi:hypothetical protein